MKKYDCEEKSMLTLTEWIKAKSIDGIDIGSLRRILNGEYPYTTITEVTPGVLIIKSSENNSWDDKIINCVADYYTNDVNHRKIKIPSIENVYAKCLEVRENLNVAGQSAQKITCKECHLRCVNLKEQGLLKRVEVSRKKKGRKNT